MAVEISEYLDSGRIRIALGNGSTWEEQYTIKGAATRLEAADSIAEQLLGRNSIRLGSKSLILDSIDLDPLSDDSVGLYRATARWKDPALTSGNSGNSNSWPPSPSTGNGLDDRDMWVDGTQISVSTEVQQQFWSPAGSYAIYGNPEYAEDLMGAIEFDGETVKGTGVPVPKATWSEEFKREEFWFHPARLKKVCEFVGKTNETEYRLFPAGSLLILSIEGSFRKTYEFFYRVTYGYSPNKTNISYGEGTDQFIVSEKKGWQYLWLRYEKQLLASGVVYPVPRAAYVHDIFDTIEFAGLADL